MPDSFSIEDDWNAQYIDGEWTTGEADGTLTVEDPSTREPIAEIPAGVEADVDAAYDAAVAAQTDWEHTAPSQRAGIVHAVADTLEAEFDELVELLGVESGSSAVKANIETRNVVATVREAAAAAKGAKGEHADSDIPSKENIVEREPEGVVTVITPWNFPLALALRAVAPAIATGNSVVLKPATNTPVVGGLAIAKLFEGAGLPQGVLNVVTGKGSEIGDAVAGHPASDVVAFTGSTEVGRHVASLAGENLALPAMELGGNNVHIVTEDADVDEAVAAGAFGSFLHQGQICISINRHLVHESVYDEYVEKLTAKAEGVPTGSVHDPETVVGPIIDESQRDDILGYVADTVDAGATLQTGGEIVDIEGVDDSLVVEPTVLSDATNDMPAACNEHFGPVAPVIPFSDVDEAVEMANATEYGLSGSVYADDVGAGKRIADRIDTGMIHVNDQAVNEEAHVPFGGTGASGIGRYNGDEIIHEVTQTKWVSLQHEPRDYPF